MFVTDVLTLPNYKHAIRLRHEAHIESEREGLDFLQAILGIERRHAGYRKNPPAGVRCWAGCRFPPIPSNSIVSPDRCAESDAWTPWLWRCTDTRTKRDASIAWRKEYPPLESSTGCPATRGPRFSWKWDPESNGASLRLTLIWFLSFAWWGVCLPGGSAIGRQVPILADAPQRLAGGGWILGPEPPTPWRPL